MGTSAILGKIDIPFGIHIPLIIRWPGRIKPGTVREDLISGIDLAASSLKLAGSSPPANMQGRDFLSPGYQEREYIIAARDRMDIAIDRMRAVRTKQFKYIRNFIPSIPYMQRNPYKERKYPVWNLIKQLKAEGKLTPVQALFAAEQKPLEELYDVTADPHEINNLAEKPEYKQVLLQLRQILDRWIKETGDQGAWIADLFVDEISTVREALGLTRIHWLGQSWGSMLAMEYALTQPPGLVSLVLASSPASTAQFMTGIRRLPNELPTEVQQTIQQAGTTDSPAYEEAMLAFYRRQLCRPALRLWSLD